MLSISMLNKSVGAFQIGMVVISFLFGIVSLQTWLYYRRFSDDRKLFKALVGSLWLLSLAHMISAAHAGYTMSILQFGNLEGVSQPPKSLFIAFMCTVVICYLVQVCYASRIYSLTGTWYITAVCMAGATGLFVLGFVDSCEGLVAPNLDLFEHRHVRDMFAAPVIAMVLDVVITGAICYHFLKKKVMACQMMEGVLDRLIGWTIQTGLVPCVATLGMLITSRSMRTSMLWISFYIVGGELYAGSCIAMLNVRMNLREAILQKQAVALCAYRETLNKSGVSEGDPRTKLESIRIQRHSKPITISASNNEIRASGSEDDLEAKHRISDGDAN